MGFRSQNRHSCQLSSQKNLLTFSISKLTSFQNFPKSTNSNQSRYEPKTPTSLRFAIVPKPREHPLSIPSTWRDPSCPGPFPVHPKIDISKTDRKRTENGLSPFSVRFRSVLEYACRFFDSSYQDLLRNTLMDHNIVHGIPARIFNPITHAGRPCGTLKKPTKSGEDNVFLRELSYMDGTIH